MPMLRATLDKLLAPDVDKDSVLDLLGYTEGDGSPSGVVTPSHIGAWYWDYTNEDFYMGTGTANTDWKQVTA